MKVFAIAASIVAALWVTHVPSQAQAAIVEQSQKVAFVAPTALSNDAGDPLSVCTVGNAISFFGYETLFRGQTYGLATDSCMTETFIPMTADQLDSFYETGAIASDLPSRPPIPMMYKIRNMFVYGAVAIVLLLIANMVLRAMTRRAIRAPARANDDIAVQVLAAMCYVVSADGQDHSDDINGISRILTDLTGTKYSAQQIQDILDFTRTDPTAIDAIGTGLNDPERALVLEAAIRVATQSGQIDEPEYGAVSQIAQMFEISAPNFRAIVEKIAQQSAAA